ncbi:hypothetical protein M513_14217, partial [Trichuris suis]
AINEKLHSRIQVACRQDGEGNQQFTGGQEVWRDAEDGDRLEESGRGTEEDTKEEMCKALRHCPLAGTRELFGRMGTTTATEQPHYQKNGRERSGDEVGPFQPTRILRLYRNDWMAQPFHEEQGSSHETED